MIYKEDIFSIIVCDEYVNIFVILFDIIIVNNDAMKSRLLRGFARKKMHSEHYYF